MRLGNGSLLHEFQNVLHLAVKRVAQRVQRLGADRFALFHAVERVRGEALLENQLVFRDLFAVQSLVKRLVAYQALPSSDRYGFFVIIPCLTS